MPDVIEVNATTGEIIERDFTPEELAQHEQDRINNEILAQELKAKYDADIEQRNITLQKFITLGLSEEEANKIVPEIIADYRILHLL
jgi:hypothetical protein